MSSDDDLRAMLAGLAEEGTTTPYAERMAALRARRRSADRRRQTAVLGAVVAAVAVIVLGIGLLLGGQGTRSPGFVGSPTPTPTPSRTHHRPPPPPATG